MEFLVAGTRLSGHPGGWGKPMWAKCVVDCATAACMMPYVIFNDMEMSSPPCHLRTACESPKGQRKPLPWHTAPSRNPMRTHEGKPQKTSKVSPLSLDNPTSATPLVQNPGIDDPCAQRCQTCDLNEFCAIGGGRHRRARG